MEVKKSPKANLEDKRLTYVLLGLVFVLSIIFIAFEWTQKEVTVYQVEDADVEEFVEDVMTQTHQEETPPPPEPEVPDVIEDIKIVEDTKETADVVFKSEDSQDKVQEVVSAPIAAPVEEDPAENVIFEIVEEMPDFPGGRAELMKYLGSKVNYPIVAIENGIQGKVVVQFVVRKDGSISDVKVVRGVDPYLDKEAARVVASMPKWKPGRQRGKAVNVKYIVPVVFRLQQ